MSILDNELNAEQRMAVRSIDGAVLIIAGAGSGKTRVITFRIAYMLERGIPQSHILALTFTNKASREMQARIKELAGKKLQSLTISTFHAFGVSVLRKHIERIGWRPNFSIYDESDKLQLIKELAKEQKISQDNFDVYATAALFSKIKTGQKQWTDEHTMYHLLYREYQENLKLYNAVDFDDLIQLPIKIFTEHPDVLDLYRQQFAYIMVDEFQDTSLQQYQLLKMMSTKNICVVGDDDQSIYSWRGASFKNIQLFEKDFPDLIEIKLEQNYRSTETILAAANGVISHNIDRKKKSLWSKKGSGKPIEVFFPENETKEADFVADMIYAIKLREKKSFHEFGVLVRANSLTRSIEEAFLEKNIPYKISGGTSFFQRREIKDVISYLRTAANGDDDINLLRIINTPRRGIGKKTIQAVSAVATEQKCTLNRAIRQVLDSDKGPLTDRSQEDLQAFVTLMDSLRKLLFSGRGLAQKVRKMIETIEYKKHLLAEYQKNEKAGQFKLLNIERFLESIDRWEQNVAERAGGLYNFLNRITLLTRDDTNDSDKSEVNVMTMHAAKGLEFPVVFIVGAERGIIPHERSMTEAGGNVEEERRLFYVAITRAQEKLYISSCRTRRKLRETSESLPSPFLDEIPKALIEYHKPNVTATKDEAADFFASLRSTFSS